MGSKSRLIAIQYDEKEHICSKIEATLTNSQRDAITELALNTVANLELMRPPGIPRSGRVHEPQISCKTDYVVWIVIHCRRMNGVRAMQHYISSFVFGD